MKIYVRNCVKTLLCAALALVVTSLTAEAIIQSSNAGRALTPTITVVQL